MQTVIRNYFAYRLSCPTPNYDQSVFHYHHKDELLEHVWTIPDRQTCFTYLQHVPEIDSFEWSLLQNVLKFNDGTLFKLCQKLNNEGDL
jgi:predicted glycosyltransferase involved in capsule biosynthesis